MRIKSYFEASIQSAIAAARRELGDEAMLLNSRKVSEPDAEPRYEVVFGLDEEGEALPASVLTPTGQQACATSPASAVALTGEGACHTSSALALTGGEARPTPAARRPLNSSLNEIQRQVADLQAALAAAMATSETESAEFIEWRDRLKEFDLGSDLTASLLDACRNPLGVRGLAEALRSEMKARMKYTELLPAGARGLVLVGPPGAGKTITLVKIAVRYGLSAGRGVRFVAFDAYRPAASEQLRTLAAAMGCDFSREETLGGLVDAIRAAEPDDLVLVDTPGFSFVEQPEAAECAQTLACLENLQIHVVLPASMKRSDLSRYSKFYSIFRPASLILTRLDETECIGAAASVAMTARLPISAHGCGPSISTDLQPASSGDAFLDRIFGGKQLAVNVA